MRAMVFIARSVTSLAVVVGCLLLLSTPAWAQEASGFTATGNGDLPVGSLEETITVSGAAPLVDTQNVRKQIVASRELLDTLPTSTKHVNTLQTLTPGLGGIASVGGQYSSQVGNYHGKSGTK